MQQLPSTQRKYLRGLAHHLKPHVQIGKNGLSDEVFASIDEALTANELIKIKFTLTERDDRRALIDELCKQSRSELVQVIGKMALVYRKAAKQNRQLSNIVRHSL